MKKLIAIAILAAALSSCQSKVQQDQKFQVIDATSKADWKGSAPDHYHVGTFKVTGALTTDNEGAIKTGDFVIPIASIQDFDLKDPVRQVLLADLKDNFFKLAIHPTAKFHINTVTPYTAADTAAIKGANYLLSGNFTMLGQTHEIAFAAKITAKGDSLVAEAKFNLDRTQWGMNNYSDPKQKLYILPDVNIHLQVNAAANKTKIYGALAYVGFPGFGK